MVANATKTNPIVTGLIVPASKGDCDCPHFSPHTRGVGNRLIVPASKGDCDPECSSMWQSTRLRLIVPASKGDCDPEDTIHPYVVFNTSFDCPRF